MKSLGFWNLCDLYLHRLNENKNLSEIIKRAEKEKTALHLKISRPWNLHNLGRRKIRNSN
jgi:hypothetical protein